MGLILESSRTQGWQSGRKRYVPLTDAIFRPHPEDFSADLVSHNPTSRGFGSQLPRHARSSDSERVLDAPGPYVLDYLLPVMGNDQRYKDRVELLQGTLDMMILRTLR